MNILESLAIASQKEAFKRKAQVPISILESEIANKTYKENFFKKNLQKDGLSFICELKKASPSKGLIKPDFNYLEIAKEYEKNEADAISCLTEPTKFLGNIEYLENTVKAVETPVLRKDFIIDEYMIYEAKAKGASAILLIAAILNEKELKQYLDLARSLDLEALVEIHNLEELEKALNAGSSIIGINNRNLKDFSVTLDTTASLVPEIPRDKIIISESGIHSKDDLKFLTQFGIDGVLIGEQLMRSPDIGKALRDLKNYEN